MPGRNCGGGGAAPGVPGDWQFKTLCNLMDFLDTVGVRIGERG